MDSEHLQQYCQDRLPFVSTNREWFSGPMHSPVEYRLAREKRWLCSMRSASGDPERTQVDKKYLTIPLVLESQYIRQPLVLDGSFNVRFYVGVPITVEHAVRHMFIYWEGQIFSSVWLLGDKPWESFSPIKEFPVRSAYLSVSALMRRRTMNDPLFRMKRSYGGQSDLSPVLMPRSELHAYPKKEDETRDRTQQLLETFARYSLRIRTDHHGEADP
ncbi:uncharacterized protein EI90DRAFT_205177 [Cantharellus anzutake]|uniref:uncharacterized protein n=1 Tax=Cantharellus anzutake TaxID=1750568 RepID=UPI001906FB08|nr:uncharacterized protein EI90DRAFT_205177 [Cantharellus anzutake]KAF8336637.1 hypothetical protein EI90DRAFT_205177 [Cantharellus anzutake]